MARCAIVLGQYDIEYRPIKGQVFADFVAEFTPNASLKPKLINLGLVSTVELEETQLEIHNPTEDKGTKKRKVEKLKPCDIHRRVLSSICQ